MKVKNTYIIENFPFYDDTSVVYELENGKWFYQSNSYEENVPSQLMELGKRAIEQVKRRINES